MVGNYEIVERRELYLCCDTLRLWLFMVGYGRIYVHGGIMVEFTIIARCVVQLQLHDSKI